MIFADASQASLYSPKEANVANYTIVHREQADDVLGDYPGEMRMLTSKLGSEQVAFTYRRMPQHSGGKGGYGHRHRTQEEIYYVMSGTLQFKLGDDVVDVDAGCAVRVAPDVARSVWNEQPADAELVIVSVVNTRGDEETDIVPDFWPA
jgi:mannose-6-phosphate isomerase-like protein (cupin superfamily)